MNIGEAGMITLVNGCRNASSRYVKGNLHRGQHVATSVHVPQHPKADKNMYGGNIVSLSKTFKEDKVSIGEEIKL